MRKRPPETDHLRFNITLEFPAEVDAQPDTLSKTLADALYDYDNRNKLLPGVGLPPGGERLIGTAIEFEKFERKPDTIRGGNDNYEPDPLKDKWDQESEEIFDLAARIRQEIERLEDLEARLWHARDDMSRSETVDELKPALRKARRTIAAAKKDQAATRAT